MKGKSHAAEGKFIQYNVMKNKFFGLTFLLLLLPALAACGGGYDYTKHLSEVRSDIFRAETEEFTVTLSCVAREYPYATDGVACPLQNVAEISLRPAQYTAETFCIYVAGEKGFGGEASFRNFAGDWFLSQSVEQFPEGSVSLRVEWGENVREITATSVKNEKTLTPEAALGCAVRAEEELIGRMTQDGVFRGEFYVRLLRRDKNYYYVGVANSAGSLLSLLIDAETGEVLARRENN